ncbi:hypothetical protein CEUSTIGMA_g6211.t1 [Chlamydomonas eustigma]|uniref:Uncharacterized protein n=1 Tax=Chlamydomonas eustigma TaxID=1157962 RepID=A0A250X6Q1_9CHLO|nr:hypothetical protein CEUSTIGMA_g6211.t1 [Chlamydomonas eustigma]|eukprot:GAX78774.1 hypothetical protein CEUSTIGMA_g6211.t1 [Chlamydomonas eustigma]
MTALSGVFTSKTCVKTARSRSNFTNICTPSPSRAAFAPARHRYLSGSCITPISSFRQSLFLANGSACRIWLHATPREEAEIESMKKQLESPDIWASEITDSIFKVIVIAGIVGVSILLFYVGMPVIDNVINSFPRTS